MSVRVVSRIRPLLKQELAKDIIVEPVTTDASISPSIIRLPNPKNEAEAYSFQFNSVYDQNATQQQLFDDEVAPTIKQLFKGIDVTLFAYGVTGTGKTHTMRGGKTLAERGMIPRMLSNIYRRSRKMEKDSDGGTLVDVVMSYYEIYNDKVFDLFEAPEKRTSAGLPIRDNGGKTVVVGLTERPCTTLKEFEQLYDQANVNRSTSATKLNAHSSRSHAVLCVKVTQTTGDQVRVSTASAIDLAGSEDNRRTENGKERMVESASINKSLFVLAQCVEAISKKQSRIPYRESKMTRILSLGQNNGLTIMILNLAPVRSYHLDTLSSLNFANRTKKIEVNEVENQPFYRTGTKPDKTCSSIPATAINRQPLRPKSFSSNIIPIDPSEKTDKPIKAFSVYADKSMPPPARPSIMAGQGHQRDSRKRTSSEAVPTLGRPAKFMRPSGPAMTQETIEALIERKVTEKLAESALNASMPVPPPTQDVSAVVQARLDALERRVEGQETERAEGLQYLLMAKQHQVRGEDASALKMYQLAAPFFPGNERLGKKMFALEEKLRLKRGDQGPDSKSMEQIEKPDPHPRRRKVAEDDDDAYQEEAAEEQEQEDEDFEFAYRRKAAKPIRRNLSVFRDDSHAASEDPVADEELDNEPIFQGEGQHTPRTQNLLRIINSRDVSQIRLLRGVGAKKAEALVNSLCELSQGAENELHMGSVRDLEELGRLKGVGAKGVEKMRQGIVS